MILRLTSGQSWPEDEIRYIQVFMENSQEPAQNLADGRMTALKVESNTPVCGTFSPIVALSCIP